MIFLELFLAILIGSCFGIVTGITPGIHINLVAALLLSISPFLLKHVPGVFLVTVIVAMSVVHTFLDFIPSCFLGAPEESTAMSALPAHVLLLQGRGFEAVKLASVGSFLGLLTVVLLLPLLLVAVPWIFTHLQNYIGIILLVVVIYMILREKTWRNKFWAFFIFMLAGIFGVIVFSLNMKDPLFPMLSGLFGISMLLTSLSQKVKIPEQRISNDLPVSKMELFKSIIAGTVSGSLVSIFPGIALLILSSFPRPNA